METINWGIIGCGDVTEVKSGPAFNKVDDSKLVAVMRRDAAKARDYAVRHNVQSWYTDADQLIRDPNVNAIYVATPPSTHEEYTIRALIAGKPVYVEKPMSIDAAAAKRMANAAAETGQKLVVAHYRRAQPAFQAIRSWIEEERIGRVYLVRSVLLKKPLTKQELESERIAWRVNPALAGGGLFHDLAPHQLDLMYYFFGSVERAAGFSANQSGRYAADDVVSGNIQFSNGVQFSGNWCFNVSPADEREECEIIGSHGRILFSFFDQKPVFMYVDGQETEYRFPPLQHVQQPMIAEVVKYFLGKTSNPCGPDAGVEVMRLIDSFTTTNKAG